MILHPVFLGIFTLGAIGAMAGIFLDLPLIKDLGFLISLLSLGLGLTLTPTPVNKLEPAAARRVHAGEPEPAKPAAPGPAPAREAPPKPLHAPSPAPVRDEVEFRPEPPAAVAKPEPRPVARPQMPTTPAAPTVDMTVATPGEPVGPGFTRGMCSQCGTTLTLSNRRPVKARCPVCGHTKLLE